MKQLKFVFALAILLTFALGVGLKAEASGNKIYEVSTYMDGKGNIVKVPVTKGTKYVSASLVKTENGFDIRIYDSKGNYLAIAEEPVKISITKTEGMVEIGGKVLTFNNGINYYHDLRVGHIDDTKTFKSVPYNFDGYTLEIMTKKPIGLSLIPYVKAQFIDMTESFAKYEVDRLYYFGIVNGTSKATFTPRSGVTRGQLSTMVARALELEPTNKSYAFKDIKGKWYEEYVHAMYQNGYINGIGKGLFAGDNGVTREQAVVIISRVLQYYDVRTPMSALDKHKSYKDSAKIADFAKTPLDILIHHGVVTANSNNFRPKDMATREELAVMLYKALKATGVYL